MITAAICLSHSPLMDRARADRSVELAFLAAVSDAAATLKDRKSDATIIFYPDHLNGFFHGRVPEFALCRTAEALGDFGTAPGALNVPADLVASLADTLIAQGFDVAVVDEHVVDHGGTQPIELLGIDGPVIPVFINCAVAPRPSIARVEALGAAVGAWAEAQAAGLAIIGSGGLSHDPPLPVRADEDLVSASLGAPRILSHAERVARQARVYSAAEAFTAGRASHSRALAPDWDLAMMEMLSSGMVGVGAQWSDDEISNAAGSGGHEVRCWVAAFAALRAAGDFAVRYRFYAPVPEWLTGMGLLAALPIIQDRTEP